MKIMNNNILLTLIFYLTSITNAIDINLGNQDSICNAATEITNGIMDYYLGTRYGGTIGMFQQPYYWWEAGLIFGGMIDTWKICNNDTYVKIIQDAINNQRGDNNDFMLANQSHVEANDDQVFWGFTVMEAAERNFPLYSNNNNDPNYAQLALNTYNSMAERWDNTTCNGGLRWQIFNNMSGWDYKNTISNAAVYALGGRLARYTNNNELVKSSNRVLKWLKESMFVHQIDGNDFYNVNDGAQIENGNCPVVNGALWSYNYAAMLMGTTYIYNTTNGDQYWDNELNLFLGGVENYMLNKTGNNVLYEYQCNLWGKCNNDQRAFRAIVARVLGEVVQLAPAYADRALKIINDSALGAAASCSGGADGKTCGINWGINEWDGWYGLGEQISALEVIQNNLINGIPPPCTENTCGEAINGNDIVLVPVPTITRFFTDINTHIVTETITVSTINQVFYTGSTS